MLIFRGVTLAKNFTVTTAFKKPTKESSLEKAVKYTSFCMYHKYPQQTNGRFATKKKQKHFSSQTKRDEKGDFFLSHSMSSLLHFIIVAV